MQATRVEGCKQPFETATGYKTFQTRDDSPNRDRSYLALGFWLSRCHPDLSHAQREVYVAIGQLANAGNRSPTKREIRMASGYHETAVDLAVQELRAQGFLGVHERRGQPSVYTMLRGPWVVENAPANDVAPVDIPAPEEAPPPAATGGTPPGPRGALKGSKNSEKQQAPPPRVFDPPEELRPRAESRGPVSTGPALELDDITRRRLLRLPGGAQVLAMLGKPSVRAQPALLQRALARLLAKPEGYVRHAPGMLHELLEDERAAALAPPPELTAQVDDSAPDIPKVVQPRGRAPDPLGARIAGLRDRLAITSEGHPHRQRLLDQLADALRDQAESREQEYARRSG